LRANLKSISHLFEVAFVWELTKETTHLPLGCLQGGMLYFREADQRLLRAPSTAQRESFIDNLLVRIHLIIVMIRWTGLAPWEFEFHLHPPQRKHGPIREALALGIHIRSVNPPPPPLPPLSIAAQHGNVERGPQRVRQSPDTQDYHRALCIVLL